MAITKCSKCGKYITDKAEECMWCGSHQLIFLEAQNGAKENFRDVYNTIKENASSTLDDVIAYGKETLKSQDEKDVDKIGALVQDTSLKPECQKFKAALESTIDVKIAELMMAKTGSEVYLNYFDAQILGTTIENIFKSALTIAPPQVTAACAISKAVLAPSAKERKKMIKGAIGIAGGTAGMGLIISGVGAALGWGAGMVASATAAFVGTSIAGPIGWAIAGVSLAGIAGYLAISSNEQTDTERFIKVLKTSTAKAVEVIWDEHGEALTTALKKVTT